MYIHLVTDCVHLIERRTYFTASTGQYNVNVRVRTKEKLF